MELTESLTSLFIQTAKTLKGNARRVFIARTVAELGQAGSDGHNANWDGTKKPFAKERTN